MGATGFRKLVQQMQPRSPNASGDLSLLIGTQSSKLVSESFVQEATVPEDEAARMQSNVFFTSLSFESAFELH